MNRNPSDSWCDAPDHVLSAYMAASEAAKTDPATLHRELEQTKRSLKEVEDHVFNLACLLSSAESSLYKRERQLESADEVIVALTKTLKSRNERIREIEANTKLLSEEIAKLKLEVEALVAARTNP